MGDARAAGGRIQGEIARTDGATDKSTGMSASIGLRMVDRWHGVGQPLLDANRETATMTKILFICMGNICRSPTAEGVFRQAAEAAGLLGQLHVDSAGTHDYHVGRPPDSRAQAAASGRGYDLSGLRGRQVSRRDFEEFDYILAMDHDNLRDLERVCPRERRAKLSLFLDFSARYRGMEVPDPYYGGARGFEQVLDMVEDAALGLLERVREELGR